MADRIEDLRLEARRLTDRRQGGRETGKNANPIFSVPPVLSAVSVLRISGFWASFSV